MFFKRITKDLASFEDTPNYRLQILDAQNLRVMKVILTPDESSLWFSDSLEFLLKFTFDYPYKSP